MKRIRHTPEQIIRKLREADAELARGTAIPDLSDLFGARSSGFENKLQVAKRTAMHALKTIAVRKGANAIIGVDLDYSEFSGNRVALILNGTLVKVAPRKSAGAASAAT